MRKSLGPSGSLWPPLSRWPKISNSPCLPSSGIDTSTFRQMAVPDATGPYDRGMCRNIKQLYNYDPPATEAEIRDAALQYVRKLSGTTRPSQANAAVFERAVDEV